MNKSIVLIIGILIITAAGIFFMQQNKPDTKSPGTAVTPTQQKQAEVKPNSVVIQNYDYNPSPLKIKVGTTVTWTNEDEAKHTVTADDADTSGLKSDYFGQNQTYTYTFNTPGVFRYHCEPHPYMKGSVEVVE